MIQNVDFTKTSSELFGEYVVSVLFSRIAITTLENFIESDCVSDERLSELLERGTTSAILNERESVSLFNLSESVTIKRNYG